MKNIFRLVRFDGFLFVVFCLFTTTNPLYAQWIPTNGPYGGHVNAFAVSPNGTGGTNLFAGTWGGVFLSTNTGASWIEVNTGMTATSIYAFTVSPNGTGGTNLFAGTWAEGDFLSTDNGTNWIAVNNGLANTFVNSLTFSGTNLFAGTAGGGIFLSTNNGTRWTAVNMGLTNSGEIAFAVFGTNLFAGTYGDGVFLSTNNGTSWTAASTGLTATYVRALTVSPDGTGGTNLFAGTSGGVFLSTNNGTSWAAASTGLTNLDVRAFAISGVNLFAGTSSTVFLSTDNGTSWTEVNTGLPNTDVYALIVNGTDLFIGTQGNGAGTSGYGIWRRSLSEMIMTQAVENAKLAPAHFALQQNYPNPFNPTTTISFSLPSKSFVSLKVFDLIGREVATLLSQEKPAGTYKVTFDASKLPSGVYFYRFTAGDFRQVKKMLLIK